MIIYCTTNLINGKKYIGLDKRNCSSYLGSGIHLKRAIRKYGKENFKKQILEHCNSLENLIEAEKYWIDYFGAVKSDQFYNIASGGDGGNVLSAFPELILQAKKKRELTLILNPLISINKVLKCKETKKLRTFIICPHCGYKGKNKGSMIKVHFDRCKKNPNLNIELERIKNEQFRINKSKPILQFTKEGVQIAEYSSIKIAKEITGANNIDLALKNPKRTSGNYKWKYKII